MTRVATESRLGRRRQLQVVSVVACALASVVLTATCDAAAADKAEASKAAVMDWSVAVAVLLCVIHLLAPHIRRFLQNTDVPVCCLGGGLATAYVFLHLLPELADAGELVGQRIYYVILLGFVLYYGIEDAMRRRRPEGTPEEADGTGFRVHLLISWVYGWLIVYAMPDSLTPKASYIIPAAISVGLHVMHGDLGLGSSFPMGFDSWGRYVLATAPVAGWLTAVLVGEHPLVSALLTALLAGFILYNVFRDEIPEHENSSFRWLLGGVLLYFGLDVMSRGW